MAQFKGIAFPFDKGNNSFPAKTSDSDLIRQSIIQILLTERGERVMRPNFGSNLMSKVFDNNDALFESVLQAEVKTAIGQWEPRAIVQSVQVQRKDETATVTVNYVVAATRQQGVVSLQLASPK